MVKERVSGISYVLNISSSFINYHVCAMCIPCNIVLSIDWILHGSEIAVKKCQILFIFQSMHRHFTNQIYWYTYVYV